MVSAAVSEARYGGTPGRVFIREGDGVVIVAGADAKNGRRRGLAVRRRGLAVRRLHTDDGVEHAATDYFTAMGGYLTGRP
ncbi:hypothetical protein [Planotetraspora phitsanulokensis]|uniref:hypothetical protein n=1 Tax=Planotetraspora phitsanulokensis TaxID=575192 RepID=UPI001EF3CC4F